MDATDGRAGQDGSESLGLDNASTTRHRSHRYPGRHRAVLVRYDDDEFLAIESAAELAGLTPTGFVASAALAVARISDRKRPRT